MSYSLRISLALLCLLLPTSLAAQTRFSATTGDVALTGAGTSFTIQQPATGAPQLQLESAVVYCSVTCNVTQAVNGAAATATTGSAAAIPPQGPPARATVWTSSNVGGGTTIGGIVHSAAAQTQAIDLSKIVLSQGKGSGANYTVTISSITGTANITLIWSEK